MIAEERISNQVEALKLYRELKSYKKVAEAQGIHLNTARQRVQAALILELSMRKVLEGNGANS